jgi:SAM-dependent methyltransferase
MTTEARRPAPGNPAFYASAEYYDAIYATIKDYRGEAAALASLLRALNPACKTILDVACGTAEHARYLTGAGFSVDGMDNDETFLGIARSKNPTGRFFYGDMSAFDLPDRYDAVVCMFSSIGYLRTLDRLVAALRCFRRHLAAGGIVVVEPWFAPGVLDPQRMGRNEAVADGVRVVRTSRVEVNGRVSRVLFDYEISDASGTRHAEEIHELGLFTTDEILVSFREAGLDGKYDPAAGQFMNRGLFVAKLD